MKRKGFTLIELLAVIAVLAIISTIATTIVIKYIDSSKANLLQIQKNEIVQAAKDWSLKNTNKLDKYHLNNTYISIDTLKETGFLENKKIINPVTKKEMEGCIIAEYDTNNKSYIFSFSEDNCSKLEDENPTKKPALSYILDKENSNENSSLVEENDYYVYKGINPNNYMKIDNNTWRIISIDKETLNLKVVLTTYNNQKEWNSSTSQDLDLSFMKSSLMLDMNNSNVLTENVAINLEKNSTWYIGNVTDSQDHSFTALKSLEKQNKIQSDIGLLSAGEYIEASKDSNCKIDYINNCLNNNYLNFNKNYWLINSSEKSLTKIENGNITSEKNNLNVISVYPVVYLNYGIQIKGSGTSDDPYTTM